MLRAEREKDETNALVAHLACASLLPVSFFYHEVLFSDG